MGVQNTPIHTGMQEMDFLISHFLILKSSSEK